MLRWLNCPRELPLSLFPDSLGSDPERRQGLGADVGVSGSPWGGLPAQDSVQSSLARSTRLPLLFPAQVFCTSDPLIMNFFLKTLLLLTPQRSLQHNERTFLMTQRFLN